MSKNKRKSKVSKTKKSPAAAGLKISRPAFGSVKLKPLTGGKSAQYNAVLEQMKAIVAGKAPEKANPVQIDVPSGMKAEVLHNRLNSVFRARAPQAPKGLKWTKRTGLVEGGGEVVLVMLTKVK